MKLTLAITLGMAVFVALQSGLNSTPLPTEKQEKSAAENARTKHFRLTKERLAIDGYDPVSYFKGGPKKGKPEIAYDYAGVIYRFANSANLAEFKTNPAKYEPVWGGWCGHAMALRGEKVEINPECYKIVNGRNVLFFRTFYANALTNWEKELKTTPEKTLMKKGDDFWANILAK